jgi:hypothetical protein
MTGRVVPFAISEQVLAAAAAAFLAQPSLARSTRRSYDQTSPGWSTSSAAIVRCPRSQ